MSDDKSHFNRQFIFDAQPAHSPATEPAPKKAGLVKSGVLLPAAIGALFGALVGGVVAIDGGNFVPQSTHQILVNNTQSVDWVTGVAATRALGIRSSTPPSTATWTSS